MEFRISYLSKQYLHPFNNERFCSTRLNTHDRTLGSNLVTRLLVTFKSNIVIKMWPKVGLGAVKYGLKNSLIFHYAEYCLVFQKIDCILNVSLPVNIGYHI